MKNFIKIFAVILTLSIVTVGCVDKKEEYRTLINKGVKELYKSNYDVANQLFEEALQLDSNNSEAYFYLCQGKFGLADYKSALTYSTKAIDKNQKFGEAYKRRAQINFILNNFEASCADYKKAMQFGIKNLDNYLNYCD